jgi:hypothetical protein
MGGEATSNPAIPQSMEAVPCDAAVNRGQAKPGTLAHLLGCEKWFEAMGGDFLVHATTVVAHRKLDEIAGHRVDGV